jgi:hypothetical protein
MPASQLANTRARPTITGLPGIDPDAVISSKSVSSRCRSDLSVAAGVLHESSLLLRRRGKDAAQRKPATRPLIPTAFDFEGLRDYLWMISVRGLDPGLPVVLTLEDEVIDHLFHPLRVGIWEGLEPKGVLLRLLQSCQQVVRPPRMFLFMPRRPKRTFRPHPQ